MDLICYKEDIWGVEGIFYREGDMSSHRISGYVHAVNALPFSINVLSFPCRFTHKKAQVKTL